MLAVSNGRLICLSTPYGRRGFFYQAWANGGDDWQRIEIPAERISRIKPAFLDEERRQHGESYVRQEYGCSFEALEGLVYPDFARVVVPGPAPAGTPVGGPDIGLRVVDGACPNLLYEAGLYRYDDATNGRSSETPLSESNHALDALRYLITRLDQRRMAKDRRPAPTAEGCRAPRIPRGEGGVAQAMGE